MPLRAQDSARLVSVSTPLLLASDIPRARQSAVAHASSLMASQLANAANPANTANNANALSFIAPPLDRPSGPKYGQDAMSRRARLYLITPPTIDLATFPDALSDALSGGDVAAVQLRLKGVGDADVLRAG